MLSKLPRLRSIALPAAIIATMLVSSSRVDAMFAGYTPSQLIETSDLIVTGTLMGRTLMQSSSQETPVHVGVILIGETLKGAAGQSIVLLQLPVPGAAAIVSDAIEHEIGQKGLWFLRTARRGTQGIYLADSPQRFVAEGQAGALVEEVRRLLE